MVGWEGLKNFYRFAPNSPQCHMLFWIISSLEVTRKGFPLTIFVIWVFWAAVVITEAYFYTWIFRLSNNSNFGFYLSVLNFLALFYVAFRLYMFSVLVKFAPTCLDGLRSHSSPDQNGTGEMSCKTSIQRCKISQVYCLTLKISDDYSNRILLSSVGTQSCLALPMADTPFCELSDLSEFISLQTSLH